MSPSGLTSFVQADRLRSGIAWWSGNSADIPNNWVAANGLLGTPDLRDLMIVGASADDAGVAKAQINGSLQQSGGIDSHSHIWPAGILLLAAGPPPNFSSITDTSFAYPPSHSLQAIFAKQGATMDTGIIMMWSGTIASIPAGWLFCDGSFGTPNLKDRMVIGGSVDDVAETRSMIDGSLQTTGGSEDHLHHIPAGTEIADSTPFGSRSDTSTTAGNYPPCYSLAYIMKD